MKQDQINYFAVGLFVLLALGLLIATLAHLSGISKQVDTYFVEYNNIKDLHKGSIVSYGGFPIGYIVDITPHRSRAKTFFKLQLAIQKDWPIPEDSEAHITAPGLLADKQIDILEGQQPVSLSPGDTIKSGHSAGIMMAMENVSREISSLSRDSLKPLVENIQTNLDAVASQITHAIPLITNDISSVLDNLNNSANRLAIIFGKENQRHVSNVLTDASQTSKNLKNISQDFQKTNQALKRLLQESEGMVSENRKDLRNSIFNLQKTVATIENSIDSIVYNLESTSRNANEFSRQIRDNPSVLLSGTPPPDEGAAR